MKNRILSMSAMALGLIVGLASGASAHPGHALHDVPQFTPLHYLTDPYHLAFTVFAAVVLMMGIRIGKKYFIRERS